MTHTDKTYRTTQPVKRVQYAVGVSQESADGVFGVRLNS